jgi:hypothetical protein
MKIVVGVLVAAAVLSGRPARSWSGEPIVIEAFSGARPPDADEWLGPVYAAIATRGAVFGPDLVARFERSTSRAVRTMTANEIVEAQGFVDRSYEFLVEGDYEQAAVTAQRALSVYATASGQLSRESALRDAQFKALLVAARAYEVLGRTEEAFRAAAEAHRTFPERQVNTLQFDPRVKNLHRRVGEELARQGRGALEVRVDDASTTIFVNERFVGAGFVKLADLLPGTYRVFVARGAESGRVHDVTVNTGETAIRALSWSFESGIRIEQGRMTLECRDGILTSTEIGLAVRLARGLEAPSVVVVGIRNIEGRRAVVGYTISVVSQRRIYGAVTLEPVAPASGVLTRLGALLGGDVGVDTANIALQEPRPPRQAVRKAIPAPRVAPWHADYVGWSLAAGGAIAGVAAGGLLWSSNELRGEANMIPEQARRRALRERAQGRLLAGSVTSVVAGGLLAAGVVKLFRHERGPANGRGPALDMLGISVSDGTISVRGVF